MDTARALSEMSAKSNYLDENAQLGTSAGSGATAPAANINPQLKGEIQSFLDWIRDNEGLSGYINCYLQQNNTEIISQLSKIYAEPESVPLSSSKNDPATTVDPSDEMPTTLPKLAPAAGSEGESFAF